MPNKPEHEATARNRRQVKNMVEAGVGQELIAQIIGCDSKTLRKHYREELDTAKASVDCRIAQTLINKAVKGDTACIIFYLKARCGWRETNKIEHSATKSFTDMITELSAIPVPKDEEEE